MPARDRFESPIVTVVLATVLILLWALRDVMVLIGFAALLAFALDPLVSLLERIGKENRRLPRPAASAVVMVALLALAAWAIVVALPHLATELGGFMKEMPATIERLLSELRAQAASRGLSQYLGPLARPDAVNAPTLLQEWGVAIVKFIGGHAGELGALVGIALVPLLTFYLLSEREDVETSALGFVPEDLRPDVSKAFQAIARALRSYVRGQSLVCLVMGSTVGIILAILNFPVAALLGTIVAVAEVVPIVGFWTAATAITLAGWGVSPTQAVLGLVIYVAINQFVGMFVTPRLMSRHMQLHPFVVIVSILAGGTLLGAAGAVLALPLAAAIQSVVSEFSPPVKKKSAARSQSG
jgi:predicted PurR-regulated permease PerM